MNTLFLSLCVMFPQAYQLSDYQKKSICKYENYIYDQADLNGIEPELLASLIFVESAFYKNAVSKANACGLTQVIPKYTGSRETGWKKYTCKQLKNPRTSIAVGAQILRYIIDYYAGGNVDKGLCIYNAGMRCARNKNLYKRSKYVKKVRRVYDSLTDGC